MSLLTTRLGIKKPQDPDPFLVSDFQTNYDLIDSYPGVFVCTSGTKPAWGSSQAGQMIFCTDNKTVLAWTGSAWVSPLALPAAWNLFSGLNVTQTAGSPTASTTGVYTLGTVFSSRACSAIFIATLDVEAQLEYVEHNGVINMTFAGSTGSSLAGGQWGHDATYAAGGESNQGVSSANNNTVVAVGSLGLPNNSTTTVSMSVTTTAQNIATGTTASMTLRTASVAIIAANTTST